MDSVQWNKWVNGLALCIRGILIEAGDGIVAEKALPADEILLLLRHALRVTSLPANCPDCEQRNIETHTFPYGQEPDGGPWLYECPNHHMWSEAWPAEIPNTPIL